MLQAKKKLKRISKSLFDIKLELENIYYHDTKIYMVVCITNNSNIDYYINYIKTYIFQNKDNSSNQYLEKSPTELFNTRQIIKTKQNQKIVFVYDQFTIDQNKEFVFELNESQGERNISLEIPNYIINNPKNKIK